MKKASQLRIVAIRNVDLAALQTQVAAFLAGPDGMTAAESGVIDEAALGQAAFISGTTPQYVFDGFAWSVFIFVTSG